ncbi:MAG TPA: ATP-binding protein [Campylobacterales bacterium]|nr:ATP-binding protein [Campylobacterales bacterium]
MECIIFTGLQASGKSTFYLENFYKTHMRINLDMLKKRAREDIFLKACVEGKQRVVIDNTNPTKEERQKYIELFKKNHFKIIGYYFESDLDGCLKRNALREGKENIPERGVKATYYKMIKPTYSEGYDELYEVKMLENKMMVTEIKK